MRWNMSGVWNESGTFDGSITHDCSDDLLLSDEEEEAEGGSDSFGVDAVLELDEEEEEEEDVREKGDGEEVVDSGLFDLTRAELI